MVEATYTEYPDKRIYLIPANPTLNITYTELVSRGVSRSNNDYDMNILLLLLILPFILMRQKVFVRAGKMSCSRG